MRIHTKSYTTYRLHFHGIAACIVGNLCIAGTNPGFVQDCTAGANPGFIQDYRQPLTTVPKTCTKNQLPRKAARRKHKCQHHRINDARQPDGIRWRADDVSFASPPFPISPPLRGDDAGDTRTTRTSIKTMSDLAPRAIYSDDRRPATRRQHESVQWRRPLSRPSHPPPLRSSSSRPGARRLPLRTPPTRITDRHHSRQANTNTLVETTLCRSVEADLLLRSKPVHLQ